jgi:hypothetical protein
MTPLHHVGVWVRELLAGIPLPMVQVLFVGALVVLLVWVLRLPAERTTSAAAAGRRRDLRPWAALALVIQILIYSFF